MRRVLVLGLPLAFFAAACTYNNGDANRVLDGQPSLDCGTPAQAKIDVDSQIAIDAGQGASVFVEYASGGHYHVRVACDTTVAAQRAAAAGEPPPNVSCDWDVIVSPEAGHAITSPVAENLEGQDDLHPFPTPTGSYQLTAHTTTEIDGFTFDTDPGASILVDAQLDNVCTHNFVWVGDGAVHYGSPSSQLTLIPSAD